MTTIYDFFMQSELALAAYADFSSGNVDPQKLREAGIPKVPESNSFQ